MFQETSLKPKDVPAESILQDSCMARFSSHTKGVMIVKRQNLNVILEKTGLDEAGRQYCGFVNLGQKYCICYFIW